MGKSAPQEIGDINITTLCERKNGDRDIRNQVPLMDGGVTLLMYAKSELMSSVDPGLSSEQTIYQEQSIPYENSKEQQGKHTPSTGAPQFLKNLISAEAKQAGAANKIKSGQSEAGKGKQITPYIPPSFSMLQSQAEEITRNPTFASPKKKITITRIFTSQSSKQKTPPEPTSLFEKFKMKSQESFIDEKLPFLRTPFVPSRNQSSPTLPSHIGVDDISKSLLDLKDEQANRRLWDKLREKAHIEEEEERQKTV